MPDTMPGQRTLFKRHSCWPSVIPRVLILGIVLFAGFKARTMIFAGQCNGISISPSGRQQLSSRHRSDGLGVGGTIPALRRVSEDLAAIGGYANRMLELRREGPVLGYGGPAVV